jgi:hypothetical protein
MSIRHSIPSDDTFSEEGREAWDDDHIGDLDLIPPGVGAIEEGVTEALQRIVHTAQYDTQGHYEAARDALTGTFGIANLDITGNLSVTGTITGLDATLVALAGLTITSNSLTIGTGTDAFSQTAFAANTFPARASTGDLAAKTITDFGLSLVDDADNTAARTTLGLVIGTNVQAWDGGLDDISALTPTDSNFIVGDGANWVAESGATARTSLGLGSIATQASSNVSITGGSITGITDLTVADGGTGRSSHTAYAVICGGTTATGSQQSIAAVGTSGQVLTSNGADALPTFQNNAAAASATETSEGLVELATQTEVNTGTDTTRVLTPATFANGKLQLGTTTATTSGTSIDVTGIPSWAKRVTISYSDVSTNGSSIPLVQIGDSGGIEDTSYNSTASGGTTGVTTVTQTAGFGLVPAWSSSNQIRGHSVLTLHDTATNTWSFSHNGQGGGFAVASGNKALSGTLDRVRLTTVNGTDTFDAGSMNILVE